MRKPYGGATAHLEDLCISITDCHHSSPKYTTSGEIVIRNYNIKNGKLDLSTPYYTDKETYDYRISKSIPEPGDIIITREAPIGEVCMIPKNFSCCLGQRMVLLKVNREKIPPLFLLYALQSEFMQIQIGKSNSTGSTVSNLRLPLLRELKTPLWDYDVMLSISKTLGCLDQKIDLNNIINKELESMAKLIYDYWFVQFDFPISAEQASAMGDRKLVGRPYKSSGGKMVWSEELKREIPEGWGAKEISEILAKTPNSTKLLTKEYFEIGSTPIVDQSRDFICGYTDNIDSIISCNDKTYVVFGDHTRCVKYISFDFARGADGTQVISSKIKNLPSSLLYQMILDIDLSNYGYARHFKFLKSSKIIIPEESISLFYANIVDPFWKKLELNRNENKVLASLRDWLLPILMNGQVKVSTTENK